MNKISINNGYPAMGLISQCILNDTYPVCFPAPVQVSLAAIRYALNFLAPGDPHKRRSPRMLLIGTNSEHLRDALDAFLFEEGVTTRCFVSNRFGRDGWMMLL